MTEEKRSIESASVSDRGLNEKRPQNEDSYLEMPQYGIFAVADGVGGAQAGEVASQMAIEIIGEAFKNMRDADVEEVMRLAIERANEAIYQMASDLPQLSSMATTVVAVHLDGDVATIGHVGDSRLYRLDPAGQVVRETNDHSVVEEEVRAGRMTAEEALVHPSRNIISRALGAEPSVEIDLKTMIAEPGTTFLLCSDGITRHIGDTELGEVAKPTRSPADICYRLKEICYDRGAEDNLTAVVVRTGGRDSYSITSDGRTQPVDSSDVNSAAAISPFDSLVVNESVEAEETHGFTESVLEEAEDTVQTVRPIREAVGEEPVEMPLPAVRAVHGAEFPAIAPGNSSKPIYAIIGSLFIGFALGAAVLYFFFPASAPKPLPAAPPPAITEMKSTNTALTAFEEARRQVDTDPAKFIAANSAAPRSAEDFFLLGRAYLLNGNYWEAKRSFNEARSLLAQAEPENAETLRTEIALALAIIESPSATESLKRAVTDARKAKDEVNVPSSNAVR